MPVVDAAARPHALVAAPHAAGGTVVPAGLLAGRGSRRFEGLAQLGVRREVAGIDEERGAPVLEDQPSV